MKRQGNKIKRYGSIYGSGNNSGSPLIVISMIAGLVLFSLIGWSLYNPIYNFIMSVEDKPVSNGTLTSSSSQSQGGEVIPTPETPATTTEPKIPVGGDFMKGIYIPTTVMLDVDAFNSVLLSAKQAGMTAIMVDAKDASGTVLFATNNEIAIGAKAVSGSAYDPKAIAKRITDAGMTPIARLHAFRDDLVARNNRDMAVGYYDTEILWLDNSPDLGGRGWLNPYDKKAGDYIVSLACELVDAGFKSIITDSAQFPSGVGQQKAGYGVTATGSKTEALKAFSAKLQAAVNAKGATSILYFPSSVIEKVDETLYGGSVDKIATGQVMVGVFQSPPVAETAPNGTTTTQPERDYGLVAKDAVAKTKEMFGDKGIAVLLQAYKNDGSLPVGQELDTIVEQAKQQGAAGCILYNPQGKYKLQ